jgi:hypothetical protein
MAHFWDRFHGRQSTDPTARRLSDLLTKSERVAKAATERADAAEDELDTLRTPPLTEAQRAMQYRDEVHARHAV